MGTTHANLYATPDTARRYYDNTGAGVADVAVGEDEFGIWFAGALRPGLTDAQLRAIRGSAPSGDWRYIGGNMELVNVLLVNTPGFPISRTAAGIERGVVVSLVAAGMEEDELEPVDDTNSGIDPADILKELREEKLGKDEEDVVEQTGDEETQEPSED